MIYTESSRIALTLILADWLFPHLGKGCKFTPSQCEMQRQDLCQLSRARRRGHHVPRANSGSLTSPQAQAFLESLWPRCQSSPGSVLFSKSPSLCLNKTFHDQREPQINPETGCMCILMNVTTPKKESLPGIKTFSELPQSTYPRETLHSYGNYFPPSYLQAGDHQTPGDFLLCYLHLWMHQLLIQTIPLEQYFSFILSLL